MKFDLIVTGEELLDPSTMLQLSSDLTLTMRMALDTPQGRADATAKMRIDTEIEYFN